MCEVREGLANDKEKRVFWARPSSRRAFGFRRREALGFSDNILRSLKPAARAPAMSSLTFRAGVVNCSRQALNHFPLVFIKLPPA